MLDQEANFSKTDELPPQGKGRNIVIFSDGTGQRGGVFFDEARTNIYKLYRATRLGPDTTTDPQKQIAFYDPGIGTKNIGSTTIGWIYRFIYNVIAQATGLGISRNIVNCYAAIIQLWRPGDRIYLFGFSRGAYTVRCLAGVIALCGIPTRDHNQSLKLDRATIYRIEKRAVRKIYQHVSSPRDAQLKRQRDALAKQFRQQFESGTEEKPNVYPFFIGVFDTVAALSNYGARRLVTGFYLVAVVLVSFMLFRVLGQTFGYWMFWLDVTAIGLAFAAYIYTHFKFAFGLTGHPWWEIVHLTEWKQKFYDNLLNSHVGYARHAISIDDHCDHYTYGPYTLTRRQSWDQRFGEPTETLISRAIRGNRLRHFKAQHHSTCRWVTVGPPSW